MDRQPYLEEAPTCSTDTVSTNTVGRELIYIVGFPDAQRRAIVDVAHLNGFDVTVAVDEASFVQDLWPTLLGYRVAAKPTLVIADEAVLSEQGYQLKSQVVVLNRPVHSGLGLMGAFKRSDTEQCMQTPRTRLQ